MSILKKIFSDTNLFKSKEKGQKKSVQIVIFFADIAGSTRMYESLGDSIAHECVVESLTRISKYVRENQGVVVEVIGDEVMAYFEEPLSAVNCACEVHKYFEFLPTSHGQKIKIRIGFFQGYVELDKGHPYGNTVNVASRLASLARGQQTVTTTETVENLPDHKKALCRPLSRVKVKGKSEPLDTVEIVCNQEDATSIFMVPQLNDSTEINAEMILRFKGKKIVIKEDNTPFTFGRGENNLLVIQSDTASRSHARIESRYGEFVFLDHSTNGSYIVTNPDKHAYGGMDMHLHHRSWTMIGDGSISLGQPVAQNDPRCISFKTKK